MKILRAEQIKEKIIYIAGPITGVPDYKTPFDAARRIFQHAGKVVIDPSFLPIGLKSHDSYMNICMKMVDEADAVVLLPGWERSKWAKLEFMRASALELKVYEAMNDGEGRVVFKKVM